MHEHEHEHEHVDLATLLDVEEKEKLDRRYWGAT
jgi:hypothetical protein